MATTAGTLELLAQGVARILSPLAEELTSANVLDFFSRLGLQFPQALLSAHPQLVSALDRAASSADALTTSVNQLNAAIEQDDAGAVIVSVTEVFGRTSAFASALVNVQEQLDAAAYTTPGVTPQQVHDFAADLPRKILDYAIIRTGEIRVPALTGVIALVGLIDRVRMPADPGDPSKPEYVARRLRLDRVGKVFRDPLQYAEDLIGWGTNGFDPLILLKRIDESFYPLAIPRMLSIAPPRLKGLQFEVSGAAGAPPGLAFKIDAPVDAGIDLSLPWCSGFAFHVLTEGKFPGTLEGKVLPPAHVEVSANAEISGRLLLGLSVDAVPPATAINLFGTRDGSRIEVAGIRGDAGVRFLWNAGTSTATIEPDVQAGIHGGRVVIDTSKADGFIGSITKGVHVEGGFDTRLAWSPSTGVRFEGSATIEIQVPLHVALGPIELSSLYLVSGLSTAGSIPIEISVGLGAKLGPLQAAIERIGAKATITFPDGGGNLGPANLDIGFKPPNGVGLAIDAGIIKGGGYLFLDVDRGEYAGALELTFGEVIALKAIGLITTKMPDGAPGFSFLIIVTADFGTGIQLGMGFTLLAVGGLLGLNRTMKLQPLMEGVRTGSLDKIMFPRDVIANAPAIISDLRTIFPPQNGIFLIGPMAKLGWGTPALVRVSLGIVIEIPGNVAILGLVRVALPADEVPILVLQVNFAGAIEFDKKRLYFFAALFESRVLLLVIEGELGLLVAFGEDANFVISVGGFHPRFSPPPLPFPSPQRISLDLLNFDWARIRVESYFALTSNTVQFGAAVEVYFGLSIANVSGHLAFDALFQFSPFHFIISLSASLSVKIFGAGLFSISFDGELEGPTPWHVAGEGSIWILFFKISVHFEVTWGEDRDTTLPPIAVMPLLKAEFEKAENWRALPPADANLFVTLRKLPEEEAAMVLHPVGTLKISQRGLPLELTLDKVGNQKPSDVNLLSVAVVGGGLVRKGDTFEQFAPAQFQDMSDAEKLSRLAFAPERAGLELSAEGEDLRTSHMTRRVVRYEEVIVDSNYKRFLLRFQRLGSLLFEFFLGGASVALADVSKAKKKQYQPFEDKIEVSEETYLVAFQSNNKAYVKTAFKSEASAREFLTREMARDGALADTLHVIPDFEKAA